MTYRLLLSGYIITLLVILLEPGWTGLSAAESVAPVTATKAPPLPDQYGISVEYGYSYDPHEKISFSLIRGCAIFDYGAIWRQDRPRALRFKVEAAAGSTITPANDLIASINMLALYYPGDPDNLEILPYLEAGIGAIYTGFRVKGQGLHYNFNPQLGAGLEFPRSDGKNPFLAVRLHHLSNGGISHENRGVNSVVLQIGRFF